MSRSAGVAIIGAALTGALMVLTLPAWAQSFSGPATPVPASYFGMHFHRLDAGTAWPRDAGIGSWRLWDANVIWPDIEPQKGQWNFSKLDRLVGMAGILKIDAVVPLAMSPTWASARPQEKAPYRPGAAAEPRNIEDWDAYVTAVATRYVGRVHTYEIWNEVNAGTGFFSGTPQALLQLQRVAYNRIKQVDPTAVVVSPSVVGSADFQVKWFDDYMALGAGQYADVIGYHFYQPREKPEAILGFVNRISAIVRKHGMQSKPLWNTESGYRMDLAQGELASAADRTWPKLDDSTAAAYVSRALIVGWLSGLKRFFWYAWDNQELGFRRPDGTETSAAHAFGRTARWLTNSTLERCEVVGSSWRCTVRRGEARALLVWTDGPAAAIDRTTTSVMGCLASNDGATAPIRIVNPVNATPQPQLLTDCSESWR